MTNAYKKACVTHGQRASRHIYLYKILILMDDALMKSTNNNY